AANKNLTMASGTGVFSQTYSGTLATSPHSLTYTYSGVAGTPVAMQISATNSPTTTADTLSLLKLTTTDAGTLANTVKGLDIDVTTTNANDTTYAAIFNGGNVGIGTTAPLAGLHVQNAVTAVAGIANGSKMQQTLTATGNDNVLTALRIAPTFTNGTFTGVANYGLLVESGNVGIGDSTPLATLTVGDGDRFQVAGASGNITTAGTLSVTAPSTTENAATITANSLTTGTGLDISSVSIAGGASGSSKILNLSRSGANANLVHTAYGLYSTVTNTNATSGTNIAAYLSASGATTANYGLIVANGNVGIGDSTPVATLTVGDGDRFQVAGATGNITTAG
ncbi:MAG: hypothetical protein AAB530_02970, partial [Patescibacteria group bacterium]